MKLLYIMMAFLTVNVISYTQTVIVNVSSATVLPQYSAVGWLDSL